MNPEQLCNLQPKYPTNESVQANKLTTLYSERKTSFENQIHQIKERVTLISVGRVCVGITIAFLFYFSLQIAMLWLLTFAAVIVYVYLVSVHERKNYQKTLLENLININKWEIKSLQEDHSSFDDGSEFIDGQHPFTFDLDIFGTGSLFQRINRTSTEPGKERLAFMLSNTLQSKEEITERQNALKELSGKIEYRQNFHAIGLTSSEKKEDQKKLLGWLKLDTLVYGKKWILAVLIIFPILSISSLLYWIIADVSIPFSLVTLTQWIIIGSYAKRVTLIQNYIGDKRHLLEKFAGHFQLINKESFAAPINKELKHQSEDAYEQIALLTKSSRALDLRLNIFASLILNSTILYDLLSVYRLEKWREQNRDHLGRWLNAIQEADALNSMGTYVFNHPDFVFPEIASTLEMQGEEMGHPLLNEKSCIRNSIEMNVASNVWIVTGANMAGKSTFLRTVGVNTVLALCGVVVFAKKFKCPLMEVYSGMRNTDSINDNQSYFFAELLRLQKIVENLREGKRLLILLDEILKGTNSVDKLTGSEELVKQLVSQPCLSIIATHDVALGEMEKTYSHIQNFHFETFIQGSELSFDFKLKRGVSTGKNATFLMKKMGIIA